MAEPAMIDILYFASLREQLNTSRERLELTSELKQIGDLINQLATRGEAWQQAFGGDDTILVAVNQEMAEATTTINDRDEIAFFPPVTGG